jgi:hypothetical protein
MWASQRRQERPRAHEGGCRWSRPRAGSGVRATRGDWAKLASAPGTLAKCLDPHFITESLQLDLCCAVAGRVHTRLTAPARGTLTTDRAPAGLLPVQACVGPRQPIASNSAMEVAGWVPLFRTRGTDGAPPATSNFVARACSAATFRRAAARTCDRRTTDAQESNSASSPSVLSRYTALANRTRIGRGQFERAWPSLGDISQDHWRLDGGSGISNDDMIAVPM